MEPLAPGVTGLYLWGDALGDGEAALARRDLLGRLLDAGVQVEARRFWPEVESEGPRFVELDDGSGPRRVASWASPAEIALVKLAAAARVPAGSPVLALATARRREELRIRACLPEAGAVHVLTLAEWPRDGASLRRVLGEHSARPVLDLVLYGPIDGSDALAIEGRRLADELEAHPGVRLCLRPEPVRLDDRCRFPGPDFVALHLTRPERFRPDPRARANLLRCLEAPRASQLARRMPDSVLLPSTSSLRAALAGGLAWDRLHLVPATGERLPVIVPGAPRRHEPFVFVAVLEREGDPALAALLAAWESLPAERACLRLLIGADMRAPGSLPRGVEVGAAQGDPLDGADGLVALDRLPRVAPVVLDAIGRGLPLVAACQGFLQDLCGAPGLGHPVATRAVLHPADGPGAMRFEPDRRDLARRLREAVEDPREAAARARRLRDDLARWSAPARAVQLTLEAANKPKTCSRHRTELKPLVVLEGPVFETTSYGVIARNLARELALRHRLEVRLRTQGEATTDPLRWPDLAELARHPTHRADVCLRSGWPVAARAPEARRWIQRVDWEYGAPPRELAALLSHGPDEVWVHSELVHRAFLAAGIPAAKLWTVPHGFDPRIFHPGARAPSDEPFTFLFVGGTIWRKGIDLLLRAWLATFDRNERVRLVVHGAGSSGSYAGQGIAELLERAAAHPRAPSMELIDRRLDDGEMGDLYRSADVLVHPYRGEGFGMPVLEAQACGLPVIVTAGGATDDFVDERSALRVASRRVHVEIDEDCLGRPWVLEPDFAALCSALRTSLDQIQELRERGAAVAIELRQSRTWANVAAAVEERVLRRMAPQANVTSKSPALTA